VFLDEPTVAMDVDGRRTFWKMMRQFGAEGRTIVFATHHLEEADQIADRVVVINHGQVVADGPGATLKAAWRHATFASSCPSPIPPAMTASRASPMSRCAAPGHPGQPRRRRTLRDLVRSNLAFSDLEVTGHAWRTPSSRSPPAGASCRPSGRMSALFAFIRFELVRLLRSWKFLAITIGSLSSSTCSSWASTPRAQSSMAR